MHGLIAPLILLKGFNSHIFIYSSASDGTSSSTKTLTIAVTDIADTAPTLTGYDFVTIPEELDFGTVIGRLFELSDVDTQDSATYALSGTNG